VLTFLGILTLKRKCMQNSVGESLLAKINKQTANLFRANSVYMTVNRVKDRRFVILHDGLKIASN
jgi:hypothetical protein